MILPDLRIEPPVEGTLSWVGSRTLLFRPVRPLAPSTRFTATIPAGVTARGGESLANDFTWTFDTPAFRVEGSWPLQRGTDDDWMGPADPVLLWFTVEVEPSDLERNATFTVVEDDETVAEFGATVVPCRDAPTPMPGWHWTEGALAWQRGRAQDARCLAAFPAKKLPWQAHARFQISGSLAAAAGNLPMGAGWETTYRVRDEFGVVRVGNEDAGRGFLFHVKFSQWVDLDDLLNHLSVDPPVELAPFGSQDTDGPAWFEEGRWRFDPQSLEIAVDELSAGRGR